MVPDTEENLNKQSLAMIQVAQDIVRNSRRRDTLLVILMVISLLVNLAMAAIFVSYESQFTTETVETITVEQDTGDGGGNNIYQAGERASYIQGDYVEGILDGEATGNSDQSPDQNQNPQEQP